MNLSNQIKKSEYGYPGTCEIKCFDWQHAKQRIEYYVEFNYIPVCWMKRGGYIVLQLKGCHTAAAQSFSLRVMKKKLDKLPKQTYKNQHGTTYVYADGSRMYEKANSNFFRFFHPNGMAFFEGNICQ